MKFQAIENDDDFVKLRTSEDPVDYNRAAYASAPESVWLEVIERYPEMRFWVAQNKTVPLRILELLVEDPDDNVRFMVANKRKATPDILAKLARDKHESVRAAVASNRSTPRWLLEELVNDPWEGVVEIVRERLNESR